ncbi:SAM-dependent methyltransferase [Reticulomyxa filosa]|uniref:SAM-dependent methyltransferase n=1 Tax=Reticulomyxa filosa TaxID=46433 RepID=X6MX66_RETFI|nr:SAM-dependent methyltransferase [Reticulomyxa filosa]|eukprot:ETO18072.1 SAM-dependent methyltransferase [Reticulomyxa filosa]
MIKVSIIFDKSIYKKNLLKAIKIYYNHNFIINEVSEDISERIKEIDQGFVKTLIYGFFDLERLSYMKSDITRGQPIEELFSLDKVKLNQIAYDEELIPFNEGAFDLIISSLSLHFINDLVGTLVQYYRSLRSKGIFIACCFGPNTLKELKEVFMSCDEKFFKGILPHLIPLIDIKDAARILQRAGFKNVISDSYDICVNYSSLKKLLLDIKGMGQGNCLIERPKQIFPKSYFSTLEEMYKEKFNLKATFEIITLTGLK